MKSSPRLYAALVFSLALMAKPCAAQNSRSNDPAVKPATALAPATSPAHGQIIRFRQRPTVAGDRVEQQLSVHLGLTTKIIQSGQVAHESANEMRRQQQRVLEVLEAVDGRAIKAKASFPLSRRQSPENANPNELSVQPIEGKAYLMHRDGDKLHVTDLDGHIPPLEEFKLVAESLENVGKPNPLAVLLVNRHVTVGQRILVPRDMVQQLLGFDDPIGTVRRFELTLVRLEPADEQYPAERAVFQSGIDIMPNDSSPLTISLKGEMVIETETCRLASVELAGPVSLSSIERTAGGIFQYTAAGDLKLAIRSTYDR
jgi:hypothetical protein